MFCTSLLLLLSQVAPPAPVQQFDWKLLIAALIGAAVPYILKWLGINVGPTPTPNPVPGPVPTPTPIPVDPNNPQPFLPNHPFISNLISVLVPILIQALVPQIRSAVKGAVAEERMEANMTAAMAAVKNPTV